MKEEIEAIFDVLQRLEIQPTQNNVTILCGVYNSLRKINKELEEKENAGTEDRATVDHG